MRAVVGTEPDQTAQEVAEEGSRLALLMSSLGNCYPLSLSGLRGAHRHSERSCLPLAETEPAGQAEEGSPRRIFAGRLQLREVLLFPGLTLGVVAAARCMGRAELRPLQLQEAGVAGHTQLAITLEVVAETGLAGAVEA